MFSLSARTVQGLIDTTDTYLSFAMGADRDLRHAVSAGSALDLRYEARSNRRRAAAEAERADRAARRETVELVVLGIAAAAALADAALRLVDILVVFSGVPPRATK